MWTLLDELRDLLAVELDDDTGFTGRLVHVLFRHAAQRSAPYRLILRGDRRRPGAARLTDAPPVDVEHLHLGGSARRDTAGRPDLLARAWVGEQLAVLTWWFDRPDPLMSLDDAARMLPTCPGTGGGGRPFDGHRRGAAHHRPERSP
ncbi:hypothetical protein HBB16_18685 [Pseudonocardia sp. MCCB 268]|nr:hypothetical protein [Pseudonocardia cytotoxica]